GIYPFKGMKLNRADVEWLLATHKNGSRVGDENDWRQPGPDGLDLRGADLRHVDLSLLPLTRLRAGLKGDEWRNANAEQRAMAVVLMEGASLHWAHLEGAYFYEAHLEEVDLREAHLEWAHFRGAHLEGALLRGALLEGATLYHAHLEGSDLRGAFFTSATNLAGIFLSNEQFGCASLRGVRWDDVELAVIDWTQVKILGDEQRAQQRTGDNGKMKDKAVRLIEHKEAVRANRKLAVALQGQGLNEEADRFAYRAQVLQKSALWYQMTERGVPFSQRIQALGGLFFSWFLFLLAGYGYKPIRSVIAYLVIIFGFMGLYLLNAHFIAPHLTWDEALVLSVSSFHGRGFFTQNVTLGDTYARLASVEAIVGLFIEISFIATFTQRFFGK
ncbi:MAG TPA: pentapeptide repeat-containing protein, partial [Ktedonobacteraceae bacterium]|nr:pentapeptide repeat-containing protein [Ktedonobacteraceae bacterium]